jgi:hypothetical protein
LPHTLDMHLDRSDGQPGEPLELVRDLRVDRRRGDSLSRDREPAVLELQRQVVSHGSD